MGKPNTTTLEHDLDELTESQWLSRITEDHNRFTQAEAGVRSAQEQYDQSLTDLCIDAHKAIDVNKIDLATVAHALNLKTKVTVTTWSLIGWAMCLPGKADGKEITKQGQTYAAESVRHIRWAVNEALNRKVKVNGKEVNVGHTVDYIRTAADTSADRGTFLTKLAEKTGRQVKAEADKKKAEAAEKDETPVTMAELLSSIQELMQQFDVAIVGDNDDKYAKDVLAALLKQFPNITSD